MALYIDPPTWPAHGRKFSHLISDESYGELRTVATALGVPGRAFDHDHVDLPEDLYDSAIRAGAIAVSGTELIRILRASGLRVPARERIPNALSALHRRWQAIDIGRNDLRDDLLRRWSEDHRTYHSPVHLLECLIALERLSDAALGGPPSRELHLAAWFHDAVYNGEPGADERASAELARSELALSALADHDTDEVARLVLLTENHKTHPEDLPGLVLIDADLAILATPRDRYRRYMEHVRHEYPHVSDTQWRAGRRAVLERFLSRPTIYATRWAQENWHLRAVENMRHELGTLAAPAG